MKADIKTKWVAALRSGQYEQTTGVLRNNKGYCCLGVLCDLYAKETGVEWSAPNEHDEFHMHGHSGVLPDEVRQWAYLPNEHGQYVEIEVKLTESIEDVSLTELNDRKGYDFKQIADVIEEQL